MEKHHTVNSCKKALQHKRSNTSNRSLLCLKGKNGKIYNTSASYFLETCSTKKKTSWTATFQQFSRPRWSSSRPVRWDRHCRRPSPRRRPRSSRRKSLSVSAEFFSTYLGVDGFSDLRCILYIYYIYIYIYFCFKSKNKNDI